MCYYFSFVMSYKMYTLHNVYLFQRFSRISQKLKHQNAETVGDLLDVLKSSISPAPFVKKIQYLFAIKDWMTPFLHSPKNHTVPHAFKFELDSNDKCQMHYKLWAQDKQWHLSGEILDGPVPGCPPFLRPLFEKIDIPSLRKDIASCYPCMKGESMQIWEQDLSLLEEKMKKWAAIDLEKNLPPHWPLSGFMPYQEHQVSCQRSEDDERRLVAIRKNHEKENTLRQVSNVLFRYMSVISIFR